MILQTAEPVSNIAFLDVMALNEKDGLLYTRDGWELISEQKYFVRSDETDLSSSLMT